MATDVLARGMASTADLVTAYQYAVAAGYTGTEEEFKADMGAIARYTAQIEQNTEDIERMDAVLPTKANIDGSYEGMTVGNAEQLVGTVGIEDEVPYLFRTSGGTADIGDRETDTLVGGTVVWNQKIQNGNFADLSVWIKNRPVSEMDFTVADNVGTITFLPQNDHQFKRVGQTISFVEGHKYFESYQMRSPVSGKEIRSYAGASGAVLPLCVTMTAADKWIYVQAVLAAKTTDSVIFAIGAADQNDEAWTLDLRNVELIDLTQLFGAEIADYVYSLEQANAGAGVAWIRKLFPRLYYAYNPGGLLSVQSGSHVTVGFNAWDEEWEVGSISFATGNNIPDDAKYRSKNYVPLAKGAAYYFRMGGAYTIGIRYYDADKNYIDNEAAVSSKLLNVPTNAAFLRFVNATTNVYAHDICINLSWDGERDGEYEPYVKREYPLDSTLILRGIPKLDADDSLYYDGDTYESDGTVTRNYGIRAYESGDEDLADVRTDGVNTVYPLDAPVAETAAPYTNPQVVDDFGTEEYTDAGVSAGTRDVAIPVGHKTVYLSNLRAKLEMAPDSPDGDGDYIVRQTNGENRYVPLVIPKELPAYPADGGAYVLIATVADGVPSLAWVGVNQPYPLVDLDFAAYTGGNRIPNKGTGVGSSYDAMTSGTLTVQNGHVILAAQDRFSTAISLSGLAKWTWAVRADKMTLEGGTYGYIMRVSSDMYVRVDLSDNSYHAKITSAGGDVDLTPYASLCSLDPSHKNTFAFVCTGLGKVSLYVNGVFLFSQSGFSSMSSQGCGDTSGGGVSFTALPISLYRIYDVALTAAQVAMIDFGGAL